MKASLVSTKDIDAWDWDFVYAMRNRCIVSHDKYGNLAPKWGNADFIKNAEYRLQCYKETGNPEYLIDAANFLQFEFMGMKGNFLATDNDERAKYV